MASKRAVLETLKVKDLVLLADKFDIQLENRRKKDAVVASVAKSRKAPIGELLQSLPLATLKASCSALAIEGKGRSKADFVELLTGPAKKTVPAKKKAAPKPKAEKTPAKKKAAAKPKAEKAPAKKKAAPKPKAEKAPAKKKAAPKPKAEKTPAKKKAAPKPKAEKTPAKKKAAAKPKAEKAPAKKKAAAKPKAEKAPAKKKAAAKPKAEKAPAKEKAAPKAEKAPTKKKKQPQIKKATAVEPAKREADPEPRQAVLDKVASIKPAETSQPDYSQIKKEYVGLDIQDVACPSCSATSQVANCQAHQCSNRFIFKQRKICASCWYERSSVSIGEYLDEDKIDTHCSACSAEIDVEALLKLKSA